MKIPLAEQIEEAGKLLNVECGACGWKGKRKPGKLVFCPECGACAGFQA